MKWSYILIALAGHWTSERGWPGGKVNVKMMDREEKVGIRREKKGKGEGALFIWTA